MDATRMCDACWELHYRIEGRPQLAQRMLNEVVAENMKAKKVRK
jgi:aromatic ring-opening dioxygenase catalytic subunit (LigB family)